VPPTEDKVKVCLGDRHGHYEPTPRTLDRHGRSLRIFVWSRTTRIAQ